MPEYNKTYTCEASCKVDLQCVLMIVADNRGNQSASYDCPNRYQRKEGAIPKWAFHYDLIPED